MSSELQTIIEDAFENRSSISPSSVDTTIKNRHIRSD